MVLVEDWCGAFKGVKGCGIYIYVKLVEMKEADFW
jgi:hypothetical protein